MKTLVIKQLPIVQSCDDIKRPWVVSRCGIFEYDGVTYTVPFGYKTDLASVPRIPGVYARYGGRAREAAVIHDWLYDGCAGDNISRKEADWIFWAVMEATKDPPRRGQRYMMWLGVRIGGGFHGWPRTCPD